MFHQFLQYPLPTLKSQFCCLLNSSVARQSGVDASDRSRREFEKGTYRNLNREETKGYPLREQRSLYRIAEQTLTDRTNFLGVKVRRSNEELCIEEV